MNNQIKSYHIYKDPKAQNKKIQFLLNYAKVTTQVLCPEKFYANLWNKVLIVSVCVYGLLIVLKVKSREFAIKHKVIYTYQYLNHFFIKFIYIILAILMAIMSTRSLSKVEELPQEWEPSFLDIVWPGIIVLLLIHIYSDYYYI
jgi:hypothetical protein